MGNCSCKKQKEKKSGDEFEMNLAVVDLSPNLSWKHLHWQG